MNRISLSVVGALASTVLVVTGTPVHAALGGASGIVIPYAGKLELNGALVTGSVDFRFDVLVDGTTTTVCQTQEIPRVPVTNGEFAVTIPAISEACVKGRDVHLQVAVRQTNDSFVVLGKQRVTPVVGAVTSGPGDFSVTGVLTAASVVVKSPDNAAATNIAEFTAQNQTQGVGVGFNTVRATGTNANVDLNVAPKGTGTVVVNGPLRVTGNVDLPAGSVSGAELASDPISCVTVSKNVSNAGGGFKSVTVLLTDFGFGSSHTRTGGGCDCGTTTTTAGRLMVINRPEGTDGWTCGCKDHVSGDTSGVTTAYVIGCRLH